MDISKETKHDDKRTIRSKRDLANALNELLQEKKFDEITIQEVCDKALISKTTFYNNFNDKQELLTFLLGRNCDDLIKAIKPLINKERKIKSDLLFYKAINKVIDFLLQEALPFREMVEHDNSKMVYYSLTCLIEEIFFKLSKEFKNILTDKVDLDIAIHFYSGAFSNLIYKKLGTNVNITKEKLIQDIYLLIHPAALTK